MTVKFEILMTVITALALCHSGVYPIEYTIDLNSLGRSLFHDDGLGIN